MSKGIRVLFTRYTMVSAHLSIIPEFLEKVEEARQKERHKLFKNSMKMLFDTK